MESETTGGTGLQRISGAVSAQAILDYSPAARVTASATYSEKHRADTLTLLGSPPAARSLVCDHFADAGTGPTTPVWSPDGTTLTYTRPKGPVRISGGVVTAAPDQIAVFDRRTRARRIVANGSTPAFSPDGRSIAYVRGSSQYDELRIVSRHGGRSREIAPRVDTQAMAWSPNGREIAFTGYVNGDPQPYLFVIDTRTRRLRRLAGSVQLTTPAWSPDGTRLAFATERTVRAPTPSQGYGAVETIAPTGRRARVLVTAPGSDTVDMAWSPDSSKIAFTLQSAPTGD